MAEFSPTGWLGRWSSALEPVPRIVLGTLALVGAVLSLTQGEPVGVLLAPIGGYLVWDACRNGGVWSAFHAFREGRLHDVVRLLAQTPFPGLLSPVARTYYHWLRGVDDAAAGRLAAARVHLLAAIAGRLKTGNDRALVHCLLAEIAQQDGDYRTMARHLDMAESLAPNERVSKMVARLRRGLPQQ